MASDGGRVAQVERSATARLTSERMDAAFAADMNGCPMYPNGTAFVAADVDGIGEILLRNARDREPTVIVYPDGEERLLVPTPWLDSRRSARIRGRLRRSVWWLSRSLRKIVRRRPGGPRTAAP